jgi:hypothetical protein
MIVLAAAAALLLLRVTSTPDLGAAPSGTDDGDSAQAIAASLAKGVEARLAASTQTEILVSERDLTVLAVEYNPDPGMFTDPQVRSRSGRLLLSADGSLGPLRVVITARIAVSLSGAGGVTVDVVELDVGDQVVPDFMRSAVDPRGDGALSLTALLEQPGMSGLDSLIECVAAVPGGVEMGFHRQGAASSPGLCASQTAIP